MSLHKSQITWRHAPHGDPPFSVETANALNEVCPSAMARKSAVRSAQQVNP